MKKLLNLKGLKVLTKQEQKSVKGQSGNICYSINDCQHGELCCDYDHDGKGMCIPYDVTQGCYIL